MPAMVATAATTAIRVLLRWSISPQRSAFRGGAQSPNHKNFASPEPGPTFAHTVSETLERGDIFFFYRPRVGLKEAHSLDEVQRTFIVLKPDRKRRYRRLI